MKRTYGILLTTGFLAALAAGLFGSLGSPEAAVQAAEDAPSAEGAAAVEPDMHEFMEYVFQPAYLRLKAKMASAPADNAGWKAIKSDSLILAEGGNLLLIRQPEDSPADWQRLSVAARDAGGQLYRAAKSKDYPGARKHYETMLQHCNACHQQFAGGEHQLKP